MLFPGRSGHDGADKKRQALQEGAACPFMAGGRAVQSALTFSETTAWSTPIV